MIGFLRLLYTLYDFTFSPLLLHISSIYAVSKSLFLSTAIYISVYSMLIIGTCLLSTVNADLFLFISTNNVSLVSGPSCYRLLYILYCVNAPVMLYALYKSQSLSLTYNINVLFLTLSPSSNQAYLPLQPLNMQSLFWW